MRNKTVRQAETPEQYFIRCSLGEYLGDSAAKSPDYRVVLHCDDDGVATDNVVDHLGVEGFDESCIDDAGRDATFFGAAQ